MTTNSMLNVAHNANINTCNKRTLLNTKATFPNRSRTFELSPKFGIVWLDDAGYGDILEQLSLLPTHTHLKSRRHNHQFVYIVYVCLSYYSPNRRPSAVRPFVWLLRHACAASTPTAARTPPSPAPNQLDTRACGWHVRCSNGPVKAANCLLLLYTF